MSTPTPHINAAPGDFAKTVLMPGDPLRSKFIAETYLEDRKLVNNVRGVQGYTGTYKGVPVSVMASGMGMPSIGIYSYELFNFFGVENILRVGSAGALSEKLHVRDIVLGQGACTNSAYPEQFGCKGTYAPIADFGLLRSAAAIALLAALLLIPVFILMNNYAFNRQIGLYNADRLVEGKDAFFAKMDRFLFDGQMGEGIGKALEGLQTRHSGLIWMLMPALFVSLLAAVQIRRGTVKNALARGALYVFVVVVCLVTLYPYYVMAITAFRSNAETLDMYFLHMFPVKWLWSNLTDIIHRGVPRYLLNSLLVAGGATALAMLCGIPAAYAMARMRFAGKKAFLGFVIMSQMFSPVVLLIGISQLMNTLHLNDSILGLMLINAAFNQAFAVWLLRGTFVSISPEMEQAALIDGCGTVGALTRVLIPMAAPGIVTALIFVFINAWNEYTISTVLISTNVNRPITVGITQFSSFNMIEWQYLFAASLLATIPVVILFMSIEKHLTAGLTSGGVKG